MIDTSPAPSTNRWLLLFSAVVSFFAVATTFFAVPPLVPELTTHFGLRNLQIGLLVGAIAIPAIFLSIPLGAAIDRWPPRAAGNAGLMIMLIGASLFAAAPSYAYLLIGRFLFGIGGLVMNLLLARLLTEAFSGRQLALAMGIFMAVYPAGMISLFSSHSLMLDTFGWRGELAVLAALALLAIPIHNLAVPRLNSDQPSPDASTAIAKPTIGRPLMMLSVAWMLFFAAFASVPTFAPQWIGGGQRGLTTVTLIMWMALVLSPVFGAVIDRIGRPEVWVIAGLVLLALTLGLMAVGAVGAIVAMTLVGLCAAAVPTATYALPARIVPAARVGFAFGFITAFSNLGTVVGPPVAGAILDASGDWFLMWVVLAALAGLGAVAAALIKTKAT
ncbi:MAG: MFS transporter [Acidobacteria bacterium]|nr:MFS transporter [Acidobacteriota bacterium]